MFQNQSLHSKLIYLTYLSCSTFLHIYKLMCGSPRLCMCSSPPLAWCWMSCTAPGWIWWPGNPQATTPLPHLWPVTRRLPPLPPQTLETLTTALPAGKGHNLQEMRWRCYTHGVACRYPMTDKSDFQISVKYKPTIFFYQNGLLDMK